MFEGNILEGICSEEGLMQWAFVWRVEVKGHLAGVYVGELFGDVSWR